MHLRSITQGSLAPFPYDDIFRCREYIEDALARPLSRPTMTFMDILEGIESGQYQFWPGKQSAIVTQIMVYPQRKGLHFFLAGGDLDELIHMQREITDWARSRDCDHVSLAGRMGWKKALQDEGWDKTSVLMAKEI